MPPSPAQIEKWIGGPRALGLFRLRIKRPPLGVPARAPAGEITANFMLGHLQQGCQLAFREAAIAPIRAHSLQLTISDQTNVLLVYVLSFGNVVLRLVVFSVEFSCFSAKVFGWPGVSKSLSCRPVT